MEKIGLLDESRGSAVAADVNHGGTGQLAGGDSRAEVGSRVKPDHAGAGYNSHDDISKGVRNGHVGEGYRPRVSFAREDHMVAGMHEEGATVRTVRGRTGA